MIKKILVAFDGSDDSNKAFKAAIEMATACKAAVFVVSAIKMPEPAIEAELFIATANKYYQERFDKIKLSIPTANVNIHYEIIVGHPAETLVNYAHDHGIDLIMIGVTKGRSFVTKLVLGSVSREVVDMSTCSVMVVR